MAGFDLVTLGNNPIAHASAGVKQRADGFWEFCAEAANVDVDGAFASVEVDSLCRVEQA